MDNYKYSDLMMDWLVELGYTHCFFVGGGNIMHLLESARTRFECVPVVHEVAAAIGVEYFNEISSNGNKAFALVTAGPGITNTITGIAGAWLDSRELLLIGGQAKVENLTRNKGVRQTGHQEIDGVNLTKTISKVSTLFDAPKSKAIFIDLCRNSWSNRKGPVFIEICLDVSAAIVSKSMIENEVVDNALNKINDLDIDQSSISKVLSLLSEASRPVLLIGAGVKRESIHHNIKILEDFSLPICLTWNGADRLEFDHELNMGRPNTYGMRFSNVIIQQADLIIALGTRLGLQQTGFSWEEFAPLAKVVQVEIDKKELEKGHPRIDVKIHSEADTYFKELLATLKKSASFNWTNWLNYCKEIKSLLPTNEFNSHGDSFVEAFDFVETLSKNLTGEEYVIPCSSGGAFTTMMSGFKNKRNQRLVSNYGLASMGYGLSGAIGASIYNRKKNTILVEGDGGFSQNLQELGTVRAQNLNLKIFIFANDGYASIRTMQKSYFNGNFLGCNSETHLSMPNWSYIFQAYDIPSYEVNQDLLDDQSHFRELINRQGPIGFIVKIDSDQTYWPKITSQISSDGSIKSNPIHLMTPALDEIISRKVFKFLNQV